MANKEKELRQLSKLKAEAARKAPLHYIGFAMVVLTIIYIVDEITSNMNAAMQPYVLFDLFNITSRNVNSPEYTSAFNVVAPIQVFSNLLLIITPFYKALSDKYGRKLFLMLNTIGMGLGMCIVMTAQNVVWYILGMLFMMFFTPNDMQVLYIMETAPKEKRATYSFIAKGIALVSVSLIGVFSRMFLRETVPSSWRMVYLIPVVSALVIGFLSYFFMRETPIFVEQRIGYLSLTDAEREQKKREDKANILSQNFVFNNALDTDRRLYILCNNFLHLLLCNCLRGCHVHRYGGHCTCHLSVLQRTCYDTQWILFR